VLFVVLVVGVIIGDVDVDATTMLALQTKALLGLTQVTQYPLVK